jgi:outer membrane protein OmpA-like peptidoglycan-associated protein
MNRILMTLLLGLVLAACQTTAGGGATRHQQKMLTRIGFVETQRGWELSMADRLLFEFDESRLKDDQLDIIANLGAQLKQVRITTAQVEGHTDAVGTDAYNLALSQARAEAVATALRNSGMQLSADKVVGRGDSIPIGDNRSVEGRADNRRVVIIVTP